MVGWCLFFSCFVMGFVLFRFFFWLGVVCLGFFGTTYWDRKKTQEEIKTSELFAECSKSPSQTIQSGLLLTASALGTDHTKGWLVSRRLLHCSRNAKLGQLLKLASIGYFLSHSHDILCPLILAFLSISAGRLCYAEGKLSAGIKCLSSIHSLVFVKSLNVGPDPIFSQGTGNRLYWACEFTLLFSKQKFIF